MTYLYELSDLRDYNGVVFTQPYADYIIRMFSRLAGRDMTLEQVQFIMLRDQIVLRQERWKNEAMYNSAFSRRMQRMRYDNPRHYLAEIGVIQIEDWVEVYERRCVMDLPNMVNNCEVIAQLPEDSRKWGTPVFVGS